MTRRLFFEAILKFLSGVAAVGLLIFVPAGTLRYGQGILLMAMLFIPMAFAGIVMMLRSPGLLEKRLRAKEAEASQRLVVAISSVMFLIGFVVAGLGFRFGWYRLPKEISIAAAAVLLLAYVLYAEVLRENRYLSRTIEVQENQRVIDTGLYGIVRHPMYSASVLLFLAMPLVLGSVYSFVIFLIYPIVIVFRIKNEEALLQRELPGYDKYMQKVTYRLIPFVW